MMKNILALWEKWSQLGLRYVCGQIKCFDGISCETWGTKLLWEILFGRLFAIPFPSEQKEAVPSCGQGAHSLRSGFWAALARPGPALGAGWVREGLTVHQILHKITCQFQLLNFQAKKCVRRDCCVAHRRCIASAGCRGSIPKADFFNSFNSLGSCEAVLELRWCFNLKCWGLNRRESMLRDYPVLKNACFSGVGSLNPEVAISCVAGGIGTPALGK